MFVNDQNPFQQIIAIWEQRCPGPGLIPNRKAFDMTDFLPWIGWVSIYDIEDGSPPRFRIRLVGTQITRVDRADNTGRYLDDVFPPNEFPFVFEPYYQSLEERRPVFRQRVVPIRNSVPKTLSKLVLPVAEDFRTPNRFINILHYADLRDLDDLEGPVPI